MQKNPFIDSKGLTGVLLQSLVACLAGKDMYETGCVLRSLTI
jgi:hypothetical protein